MKLISFAVPCYNSENYMKKCIDSLLVGKEKVEIILIDDGSTDNTPKIADNYQEKYPDIIRVIHKENGGHGSGIMAGLEHATGLYYMVVDSDDWADPTALTKLLDLIESMLHNGNSVDLLVANYVYEHVEDNTSHTINYHGILPCDRIFTWDQSRRFGILRYLTMHSAFYKTELLRNAKLNIPLHTFYVDNVYLYVPLPMVKTLYYCDVDFYRYYIGRSDQSVNESIMIKRVDQHLLVSKLILESHDLAELKKSNKKLYIFMRNYASIIVTTTAMLLTLDGSKESIHKLMEYWKYLKEVHPKFYPHLRYRSLAGFFAYKNIIMRKISLFGYRMVRKFYKFT